MYEDPQDMFREMDEIFSRLFTRMNTGMAYGGEPQTYGYRIIIQGGDGPGSMAGEPLPAARTALAPVAEVHRLGNEVKVVVELPGADPESIRLDVNDTTLTIDAAGCGGDYHTTADVHRIDAASRQHTFRNGVLEVTFATAVAPSPE